MIVDLLMPGIDGFDFISRFRQLPDCREVPVVVWTIKDLTQLDLARLGAKASAIVSKKTAEGPTGLLEALRPFMTPALAWIGEADVR